MNKALMNLTKNKYVFYVVSLLAILNVLGYFSMRSSSCVVMFAAVTASAKCYAKNWVIALLAGLFVANFVFGCNQVKENFEEAMNPVKTAEDAIKQVADGLGEEEKKCKEGEKMVDGECVKEAQAAAGAAADAMTAVKQQMAGMKGMEGMGSVLNALTNMGK